MGNIAGTYRSGIFRGEVFNCDTNYLLLRGGRRELAEPQKLLNYLLQPRVLTLDTETVAVYLQAALKIFGVWTAELADRWDNDDLPKVKSLVDTLVD